MVIELCVQAFTFVLCTINPSLGEGKNVGEVNKFCIFSLWDDTIPRDGQPIGYGLLVIGYGLLAIGYEKP